MQGPPQRSQQHFRQHPRGHQHAPLHAKPAQPAAATKPTKAYNPRHPERTLLYRTVAEHFETWLELASAGQFDGQGDHHTRFALSPYAIATAATDAPGRAHSASTGDLNSVLCLRRGARLTSSMVSTSFVGGHHPHTARRRIQYASAGRLRWCCRDTGT